MLVVDHGPALLPRCLGEVAAEISAGWLPFPATPVTNQPVNQHVHDNWMHQGHVGLVLVQQMSSTSSPDCSCSCTAQESCPAQCSHTNECHAPGHAVKTPCSQLEIGPTDLCWRCINFPLPLSGCLTWDLIPDLPPLWPITIGPILCDRLPEAMT